MKHLNIIKKYVLNYNYNFTGRNQVYTVQSTLRFEGRGRPEGDQLIPADRGVYGCIFENEVKRAETTMHLRIEREFLIVINFTGD